MFLLPIKLDRVSFETMGRQNLQKYADFLIESIVFCPLVPPSWISLVDPTSAMYASAIYVSYIYGSRAYYVIWKESVCLFLCPHLRPIVGIAIRCRLRNRHNFRKMSQYPLHAGFRVYNEGMVVFSVVWFVCGYF